MLNSRVQHWEMRIQYKPAFFAVLTIPQGFPLVEVVWESG